MAAAPNRDDVNRGELLRLRYRVGTMAGSGAPLILIAAADDAVRQRLVADVEHRFGADYAVVGAVSGGAALDCVRGRPDAVSAVIARRWLADMAGVDLLAQA